MHRWIACGITLMLAACSAETSAPDSMAIMPPNDGDRLWFFNESPDEIGSGGAMTIYVDHETHPHATASFAKYTMGVGHALPVHRHAKTEEFAYIISGEGAAVALDENGERVEIPIAAGYVWYNPPGVWHAVVNQGETPLEMIFATVPNEEKGLLSFFRRIGTRPGTVGTPIPAEEFERLAAEHDMMLYDAGSEGGD